MKSNIFIPETIKVGYQERSDTYTKKLAYIIYIDEKGKIRKEASWNSWRDQKIDATDFVNVPTSGFVLNKKAGGYSSGWNHRQTYVRVYDPRGFEFEIDVPNLLYILENTNSIKGKGLDGEFVYGWDGKELILIPTESPDYVEISEFNKIVHEKNHVKSKELVIGGTYKAKDSQEWTYMGRFDYHDTKWNRDTNKYDEVNKGKHYYFAQDSIDYYKKPSLKLLILKSLGDKFIGTVTDECAESYADMFDRLECRTEYSPYDKTKDKYLSYTYDSLANKMAGDNYYWGKTVYLECNEEDSATIKKDRSDDQKYYVIVEERYQENSYWGQSRYYTRNKTIFEGTLEQIHDTYKPMYRNEYLVNGKLYKKGDE